MSSRSRVSLRSKVQSLVGVASEKASSSLRLALGSRAGGFEKVVGMVDGMVGVLEGEQGGDDKMDTWCKTELDTAQGELKTTEGDISDLEASLEEQKDDIDSVAAATEALKTGLVELDKSVAEATEQRKQEHQEYIDSATMNQATVELIGMAKNRMNKFYNPSQYKEPEKAEEEEFFAQVADGRANPGPAPEMPSGPPKKQESGGVIAMMDDMVNDVEDEMAEAKRDEEEAQKDYEEEMNDAATKRSDDSKLVVTKEGEKAEKTGKLEEDKELKRTKSGQLDVLESKIDNTHKVCDFLMAEYAKIKEERTKEEEGLKASKQVLAGATFLQRR